MSADFSVVAIIAAYNEADIIDQVVADLIAQGAQVYVIDDSSTDDTVAKVEPFVGRGVIGIERFAPSRKANPNGFDWRALLNRKAELAAELDASWFIHHDADEFRESPWSGLTLVEAIERVDRSGFNAIDFATFDFWPTDDTYHVGDDVRMAFSFCSAGAFYNRVQIRAWKKAVDVDLVSSGGHEATFAGRRVFPLRFVLRHYPIRGQSHGVRKIFVERRERFLDAEREQQWHVQYNGIERGASLIRDSSTLMPYDAERIRLDLVLRHRDVEALTEKVEAHQLQTQRLEAAVAPLEARTKRLEHERQQLVNERHELQQQASRLSGDLETAVRELDARRLELAHLTALLDTNRVHVSQLERALAETRAEADRWRTGLEEARHRTDDLRRSLSWRLTAPLRSIYRALTGRAS
ncbi:MAG TPA: glycosyltransferase family 2 protein [Vicinamibacterales bacterium]|nr:glycosyltransferase family 2 protein [Vicinamibacterales bacterium]